MADTKLIDDFDNTSDLHPNVESHENFIALEPEAGIPLEVSIRLQINGLVRPLVVNDPLTNIDYPIT